jgi:predicted metal-binding membrane protein
MTAVVAVLVALATVAWVITARQAFDMGSMVYVGGRSLLGIRAEWQRTPRSIPVVEL